MAKLGGGLPWGRINYPLLAPPEHQNFFGMDEVLGPVAVSLRREEKEGSGGGTLHSYRVIVRTTQVGWNHGIRLWVLPSVPCMNSELFTTSSAPDPTRYHLRGRTATRAPKGPVPKEASGARGTTAEPKLPATGLRFSQGATHTAYAG